jgi:hypothetical protein
MVLCSVDASEQMLLPVSQTKNQKHIGLSKSAAAEKKTQRLGSTDAAEDMRTSISYVFSVGACNKNREIIIAAVAEIVIGIILAHQNSPQLYSVCESIARTSVTTLPLPKHRADDSVPAESLLSKDKDIEWAALKLLLKFLKRFQRFLDTTNDNDIFRLANQPSSQKISLTFAHKKVVSSIALLVSNCREVACFVNKLVGVEAVIKKSGQLSSEDSSEYALIQECLVRLKLARQPVEDDSAKGVILIHLIECSDLYTDPDGDGKPCTLFL